VLGAACSVLQNANCTVCKTEPFSHHGNYISQQSVTQPGVLALDTLIGAGAELVKHANQLRLHRGATRLPRDEAHLTDRRVRPQAAHADRGAACVHHDPDPTVQDEMHGVGRIALAYDNFVWLKFNPLAMLDQLVSILRTAERFGKPLAQGAGLAVKAEQVKVLVEELKLRNYCAAVEHRRIYRPWGYYQDVDIAARYRVKRIVVKPGSTLSLQKHFHRSEHWVVVKGTPEVTIGNDVRNVHENESSYIPIGSIHRLANPGRIPLELIEVQVGSYLGEDDIVRLDDVYGRG
jgi:mannose-6-phosphate isomerase-like protein (cupin superfamily)